MRWPREECGRQSPLSPLWPARFWRGFFAVLLFLRPLQAPAIEIEKSELDELEGILTTLETRSTELAKQLSTAKAELVKAQTSLTAAEKSWNEYALAAEEQIHRLRAERDLVTIVAMIAPVVAVVAGAFIGWVFKPP